MDGTRSEGGLTYRTKIVIVSIIVILFLVLLIVVRSILTPFIWGAVVAYLLTPMVNWLSRRMRLPRVFVLGGLYLVFGTGVAWALYFLVPFLIREAGDFTSSIPLIIASLQEDVLGSETFSFLGITLDPQNISASILRALGASPMGAVTMVRETATFIAEIILFLAVTFYLTSDAPRIRDGFYQLFPMNYRPEAIRIIGRINRVLGAYIRGQFILIILMSSVTWIFLGLVLKVKFALLLSLMTGVLEIIPFIGPITAGAIATSVALFQPNDFGWPAWGLALAVVAVYFVLRHAEDYLVIPNLIGRIVEIHPVVVIFAVLAGVVLGGITGMLLAVPTAATLKVILDYVYSKLVA